MRHRFEIRKKIMLTMAFMTIIPVLVMGIVSTAQSRNIIKEQTNTLARKNLIITAQEINEKVDLLYATIQELPTNTVVLSGLRRLPDTSEAHLSYQEQLETELYSARNLLRLKMPSSYALVFPDGSCYSTYLAPGGDGRNRLDAYAWYQALSSSNYSRVWYGVSDDLFTLCRGQPGCGRTDSCRGAARYQHNADGAAAVQLQDHDEQSCFLIQQHWRLCDILRRRAAGA